MNEERIFRQLFDNIGLGHLFNPKKKGPELSTPAVYTSEGKRMTQKQAPRHETAYDIDGNPIINPHSTSGLISQPVLPTPIGNIIEAGVSSVGQYSPALGTMLGIAAGRWQGGLRNTPKTIYPYKDINIPIYGKYTKVSDVNQQPFNEDILYNVVNQWKQHMAAKDAIPFGIH